MVRSAYLHRLVLGRSAFEPPAPQEAGTTPTVDGNGESPGSNDQTTQQYDARGRPENPASRALVRQSRRARNDVLSTVGVCVYVDDSGKIVASSDEEEPSTSSRRAETRAVAQEDGMGVLLEGVDLLLSNVVSLTLFASVRKQIQTFTFYSETPLRTILNFNMARPGKLKTFFAGTLASVLFFWLEGSILASVDLLRVTLLEQLNNDTDSASTHRWKRRGIFAIESILKTSGYLALLPLHFYGGLQHLGLLPAWPLLPNPLRLSYLLPLVPPLQSEGGSTSLRAFGFAFLTSPLAAFLCVDYFLARIDNSLVRYSQAAIPRPDNPDSLSLKLKESNGIDTSTSAVTDCPTFQGSLREEIVKDFSRLSESCYVARAVTRQFLRGLLRHKRPAVEFPDEIEEIPLSPRQSSPEPAGDSFSAVGPSSRDPADYISVPSHVHTDGPPMTGRPGSPASSAPTSDGTSSPMIQPSNVHIRTRTGSTSTLHMDVEINASSVGGVPLTSSFTSSPRTLALDQSMSQVVSDPHYRVTSLTLAPSRMLGMRIRSAVATFLTLPLESFFLRSLALAFLSANPAAGQNTWLISQIYPVSSFFRPRFGFPHWPSALDYMGKVLLCIGIDTFLDLEVWHTTATAARWIGRGWYSWGQL